MTSAKKNVPQTPTAEVISIGNELLIGHTLDTNSHWIAKNLNRIGWQLERVTQLCDSLESITSGVREAIRRRPRVLITLGGLGPTHDDITLAGIGRALHRPLKLNREALALVTQHYRRLESQPTLTNYRRKMATLPTGATPLRNPVGTAPGIMIQEKATAVFSLPGVPPEMKAIFRESLVPHLKAFHNQRHEEFQFKIAGIIESALAPILDEARRAYPGVYFKSHPRGRETGPRPLILLHIYSIQAESEGDVKKATEHIIQRISRLGGVRSP